MSNQKIQKIPQVIYIAGYGRSGSTLLDVLLGNHSDIESMGELTYFFDEVEVGNRSCACGQVYSDCDFWGGVEKALPVSVREAGKIIRKVEKNSPLLGGVYLMRNLPRTSKQQYQAVMNSLLNAAAISGAKSIVDSSKTAGDAVMRPLALKELCQLDVKMIHLIRSPWSTWKSVYRKGNWEAEGYRKKRRLRILRSIPGWILANLSAVIIGRILGRKNYIMVSYEELIRSPRKIIGDIGKLVGHDLCSVADKAERCLPLKVGHNVGGNRLRFNSEIVFRNHPKTH